MARLNVNINHETAEALATLSDARGITVTELIRRVISLYSFIEEREASGSRLWLADVDGTRTEWRFL